MTTTTQPAELPDLRAAANAVIAARDQYGWSSEVDAALNVLRAVLYTQPAELPALSDEREAFDLIHTLMAHMNEAHLAKSEEWKQANFAAADQTESKLKDWIRAALAATGAQAQADQAPAEGDGLPPMNARMAAALREIAKPLAKGSKSIVERAADMLDATGDTNGRCDGLRPAVHGGLALGGYTHGALADLLWASPDVMGLNAELGLTMDQLVRLAGALSKAFPDVQPKNTPLAAQAAPAVPEGFSVVKLSQCAYRTKRGGDLRRHDVRRRHNAAV